MVSVHVEVKRPWRSRRAGSLDGSRTAETGAYGVSRAPDTDEASVLGVVFGRWWQKWSVVSLPVFSSSRRNGVFLNMDALGAASQQENR